ncbi:MAG: right-handed parallel beta-helix repeat-containing protein [Planctomycetota bacterium]|nr:right-handed parallel beta-helix repeat-containing protein [Planctomycetota bacterium]
MRGSIAGGSVLAVLAASSWLAAAPLAAGDGSEPMDVQEEPATLHCLAVRWPVKGDDNANAVVEVQYRKAGDADWKKGYPLFRTERTVTGDQKGQWNFSNSSIKADRLPGGWIFAGSVVDLEPDTVYEVKLSLKDPDGGDAEKTLKMRTIGEPKEPPGMSVRYVAPGEGGGSGTKEDPFKGIEAAVAAMKPGDLFLLEKGRYEVKGTLNFTKSGEPGKPIIFRGAGTDETIIDGGGDEKTGGRLISANKIKHIWLEEMTIQGRQYAIVAHEGSNWVIRRCRFQKMEKGFVAHNGGYNVSRGHFISDNVFTGPTTWPRTKGIEAYCATYMSGSGHVVCYNRMQNLGDGTHGTGHGNWSACDIHNNDVHIATDDGFEADYGETNIRVFRNRIVNVAHGITAQPSQGGPLYFFRNVIYNATYSPFKLHNDTSGVLIFHNTCLRNGPCFVIQPANETVSDIVTRNNLFLGTGGAALPTTGRMTRCDFDSDGWGGFKGEFARWNGKGYKTWEDARAAGVLYKNIGAYIINPETCFASGLTPPADPNTTFKGEELDFRLKEGSDAVDKGVVLPNFNDGFKGKAPDLGAIELGDPQPHYGPRPKK